MQRTIILLAIILMAGCRATLPPPVLPLAVTPGADFRSVPPPSHGTTALELKVETATRADGLTVLWVARPAAAVTSMVWVSPRAGLQYKHIPGLPQMAVDTQSQMLGAGVGRSRLKGHVDLSGAYLVLRMPADEASVQVARFASSVTAASTARAVGLAQTALRSRLRKEGFGGGRLGRRISFRGIFGEDHTMGLSAHTLAKRAEILMPDDISDFWRSRAGPGQSAVVIVGRDAGVLAKKVLASVQSRVGPSSSVVPWAVKPGQEQMRIRVVRRRMMPWITVTYPVPAAQAAAPEAEIASLLLGNSLTGRLGKALRLDSGHSYALLSDFEAHQAFGTLKVRGNVGDDDVPMFLERVLEVVNSLKTDLVTEAELTSARGRWRGIRAKHLATTRSTAVWIAKSFARSGRPPNPTLEAQQLALVDAKRVQLWAREALNSQRAQAVILAHAQAILPLTLLGDAAQVRLDPF